MLKNLVAIACSMAAYGGLLLAALGPRQNSSNCDRQRHSDKNSRLICSACLTYEAENIAV